MHLLFRALLNFSVLVFLMSLALSAGASQGLRSLPVQDAGRVKPFDTFARESLQLMTGKATYNKSPAYKVLLTWLIAPEEWMTSEIIEISNAELKKAMRLEVMKTTFSPKEVFDNDRLSMLFQELGGERASGRKLDPYFQAVQRLESQLFTFRELTAGRLIRVWPPSEGPNNWLDLTKLGEAEREAFQPISAAFVRWIAAEGAGNVEAAESAEAALDEAAFAFQERGRQLHPELYPKSIEMKLEVHYNDFHPFRWAWVIYLLAAIALALSFAQWRGFLTAGYFLTLAGFLMHTYGFALRVFLSGRPPISNMYETVVWVPFGTILFAAIIYGFVRNRMTLILSNSLAVLCLIIADMAPVILDPAIQPLEPVLRSSYWLITHVMVITISYSAFLLAFGVGIHGLTYYLRSEKRFRVEIANANDVIYRAIQIGVVLLAAGIILGGIWADESWGRFWGWDPKETWALIALLGYLAMLHGRMAGWLRQFGMMAWSVISFSLVVMAWYGVNFVLGAGLHSYGFGAGGVEYVGAVVALVFAYVFYVTVLVKREFILAFVEKVIKRVTGKI